MGENQGTIWSSVEDNVNAGCCWKQQSCSLVFPILCSPSPASASTIASGAVQNINRLSPPLHVGVVFLGKQNKFCIFDRAIRIVKNLIVFLIEMVNSLTICYLRSHLNYLNLLIQTEY